MASGLVEPKLSAPLGYVQLRYFNKRALFNLTFKHVGAHVHIKHETLLRCFVLAIILVLHNECFNPRSEAPKLLPNVCQHIFMEQQIFQD